MSSQTKMRRDWGDYRKLFTQLPPAFERLPFSARALAAELGRRCDRKGRIIPVDSDGSDGCASHVDDLMLHVRAHQGDRGFIEDGVRVLLEDTFLVVANGWLTIRNFEDAQESDSAKRMRAKRAAAEASDACDAHPSPASPGMVGLVGLCSDQEGVQGEPVEPTLPASAKPDPVAQVFDFWASETGHKQTKLDAKRRARIKARLAEGFTFDDLADAIRGRRQDGWLMGTKEGARPGGWDGVETLLRDAAQVERLRDLHRGTAPPDVRPPRQANSETYDFDWMEGVQ